MSHPGTLPQSFVIELSIVQPTVLPLLSILCPTSEYIFTCLRLIVPLGEREKGVRFQGLGVMTPLSPSSGNSELPHPTPRPAPTDPAMQLEELQGRACSENRVAEVLDTK